MPRLAAFPKAFMQALSRDLAIPARTLSGEEEARATFRGVTMRLLPAEGEDPAAIAIVLEHTDPGLSVPVFLSTEAEDASAIWKSWSRVLGLPLLVDEGDGTLREPYRRLGPDAGTARAACRDRKSVV